MTEILRTVYGRWVRRRWPRETLSSSPVVGNRTVEPPSPQAALRRSNIPTDLTFGKEGHMGIRPHWRKMSWVVLIWNLLMVIGIIAAVASAHTTRQCVNQLGAQACHDVSTAGAAFGVVLIIVIWLIGDIILGILWLVTKGNRRACPACGLPVKAGIVQCKKCGYDFRTVPAYAASPVSPPTVPAGWFPDPQGSGQLRYWDGRQWTATTRPN